LPITFQKQANKLHTAGRLSIAVYEHWQCSTGAQTTHGGRPGIPGFIPDPVCKPLFSWPHTQSYGTLTLW